jgi:hypothetical protein
MVDGHPFVKLDRAYETLIPWDPSKFELAERYRPVSSVQKARIAQTADRELCATLGLFVQARKEWGTLTPKERERWCEGPPDGPQLRRRLYRAIMKAFAPPKQKKKTPCTPSCTGPA